MRAQHMDKRKFTHLEAAVISRLDKSEAGHAETWACLETANKRIKTLEAKLEITLWVASGIILLLLAWLSVINQALQNSRY